MGRTSKVVTGGLLVLALAAVTVPAGLNLYPALLPRDAATAAAVPAAQLAPTTLHGISGVTALSAAAPLPDPAALTAGLDAALAFDGGTFSAYVADAATGKLLYSKDGDAARTPASNLKLLTATAALKTLGANTRMDTSVVQGSVPGTLVLKAGGDSMLAAGESDPQAAMGHAGLATLAQKTAAALAAAGTTGPVKLAIDDSLFTGPALNPGWDMGDVDAGEIAPIYPMALYGGRTSPGSTSGPRPQDSAVAVAEAFAAALEKAGVPTTGTITRTTAGTGTVLAKVESATVAQQVQYLLAESDNYVAEVMARLVAVKQGQEASNTGAVTAVRGVLASLGLPLDGVSTVDNCGLAVGDLISAHQLVQVVSFLVAHAGTDEGQALGGLPIAGLTGTLGARFTGPVTAAAAGLVRAKTGTLHTVSTLSGYVVNAEGRLLVFSIMGNKLAGGPASAMPSIDTAAAIIAKS